jgi:hypothetical protein
MAAPAATITRVVIAREGHVLWLVDCPHCGKIHTHGGVPGHRVAHCPEGRGVGYVLVPAEVSP